MTRLLELFLQDEQTNKKKQIIGSIANERSLRLFEDEGAKKSLYKVIEATGNNAFRQGYSCVLQILIRADGHTLSKPYKFIFARLCPVS